MSFFDNSTCLLDDSSNSIKGTYSSWGEDMAGFFVGTTVSVGIFASSSSGATESSGGDAAGSTSESGAMVTDTPGGALAAVGVTAVGSSSYSTTGGQPDAIIEVFFRNQVPYTVTERRAENVYAVLHGGQDSSPKHPVLIAETKEAMMAVQNAFGNYSLESISEKLDIFEELLLSIN